MVGTAEQKARIARNLVATLTVDREKLERWSHAFQTEIMVDEDRGVLIVPTPDGRTVAEAFGFAEGGAE